MFHAAVDSDTVVLSDDHQDYAWVNEEKAIELLGNAYSQEFHLLLAACR